MLKKTHYIALGLIVVGTLTILNLPDRTTARLKAGIGSIFLPLFGLASASQDVTSKAGDALVSRGDLLKENEALRHENAELRVRVNLTEELARENARLREAVGWKQRQPRNLRMAKVVLREPANWWRTVQIDLGSRDGIKENMPVLTPAGLVGRISSLSLTHSQVALLGDPNCKVAARVQNPTHDIGIIGASGPLESGLVELSYLSRSANLKPGQLVETSGNGGIFPPGILIGQVVDSQTAEYGLYTVARVKLAANLNALEEVWVMIQ